MWSSQTLKKKKKQKTNVEKLFKTYLKYFASPPLFSDILDSMGSMSAENRRTQKHAANDSLQQESPAAVDG